LALLAVVGCNATPTAQPDNAIPETIESTTTAAPTGYPQPWEVIQDPLDPGYPQSYPAPHQENPEPVVQDENLAVVRGVLLRNGEAVTEGSVFLSEIVKDQAGNDFVVSFDRTSPLNSGLSSAGEFAIPNVPLGRYGLVYDLVTSSVLLIQPGTTLSVIVEVNQAGEVDLGELDQPGIPLGEN